MAHIPMSDRTLLIDGVSVPRFLYGTAWKEDETRGLAELALRDGVGSRSGLVHALAATDQKEDLKRLDDRLRQTAAVVPISWVVDARLVSPRLEGWREDVLGNVDYTAIRSRASSRGP